MKKEHFEILLEDIQGTNQLLLEGQVVLQNQLDQIFQSQSETSHVVVKQDYIILFQ